jgi:hypothetical protein
MASDENFWWSSLLSSYPAEGIVSYNAAVLVRAQLEVEEANHIIPEPIDLCDRSEYLKS